MFKQENFEEEIGIELGGICWDENFANVGNVYLLEVVGRVSETQLQVGKHV